MPFSSSARYRSASSVCIIHLRLPQLLCDLLRPAKRVLFLLHGLQPFSQHGIERGFAARERFELLDRQVPARAGV